MSIARDLGGQELYFTEKKTLKQLIDCAVRFYVDNSEQIKKTDSPQYFGYQKHLNAIDNFVENLQSQLESKINKHSHPAPVSERNFGHGGGAGILIY